MIDLDQLEQRLTQPWAAWLEQRAGDAIRELRAELASAKRTQRDADVRALRTANTEDTSCAANFLDGLPL